MTRKLNRNSALSVVVVVPLIAILIAFIAMAALAQMPDGGQRFVSKVASVADQHANALSGDGPAPVPLINLPLVPDATAPGGTGFTLTVNGTGFVSSSVVNWNGSPRATTFVSSSQLTAKIAASDVATAGTVSVSVVSPAPGGGKSNVVFFPVTPNTGDTALFNQGASLPTGEYANSVAVGDFNGDGNLDFAVASWFSGNVYVYLGDGAGNFTL